MTATLENTETVNTETAPSVTIAASELLNILGNAAIFASTDKTLPILNAVRLTVRGKYLVGTATDRYQLAEMRGELAEEGNTRADEFAVTVPMASLKLLMATIKAIPTYRGSYAPTVGLTTENNGMQLQYVTLNGIGSVPLADGDFPKVASLLASAVERVKGAANSSVMLGFNPKYLANLGKVKVERNLPVKLLSHDAGKPVVWAAGDNARGMIMPVRLGDATAETVLGEWADC